MGGGGTDHLTINNKMLRYQNNPQRLMQHRAQSSEIESRHVSWYHSPQHPTSEITKQCIQEECRDKHSLDQSLNDDRNSRKWIIKVIIVIHKNLRKILP